MRREAAGKQAGHTHTPHSSRAVRALTSLPYLLSSSALSPSLSHLEHLRGDARSGGWRGPEDVDRGVLRVLPPRLRRGGPGRGHIARVCAVSLSRVDC